MNLPEIERPFQDPKSDYVSFITSEQSNNQPCYAAFIGANVPEKVILIHNSYLNRVADIIKPFFDQKYYNHTLDVFAKEGVIESGFSVDENLQLTIENFPERFKNERLKTYNLLCVYRFLDRYPNFTYNLINYVDNTKFDFWSIFYYMSKTFIDNYGHNILNISKSTCYNRNGFICSILARKVLSGKIHVVSTYRFTGTAIDNLSGIYGAAADHIPAKDEDVFEEKYQKFYDIDYNIRNLEKDLDDQ